MQLATGKSRDAIARRRAQDSPTVQANFFEVMTPPVAFCLGFIFACGTIKKKHKSVLKLRVSLERVSILRRVLELMNSKHAIQLVDGHHVAEICNSQLVHDLVTRWGPLPSKLNLDPPFPKIADNYIRDFSIGHLAATGIATRQSVKWFGSSQVVNAIATQIGGHASLGRSETSKVGSRTHVGWHAEPDVRQVFEILRQATTWTYSAEASNLIDR